MHLAIHPIREVAPVAAVEEGADRGGISAGRVVDRGESDGPGRGGVFAQGVVAGPFHKICDTIASSLPSGTKVPQAALLHAFKEAGWIDCGRIGSTDFQTKRHIFAAGDVLARYKKSELRRMVEYVAPPGDGVVKL
jgi:hypothetical protein